MWFSSVRSISLTVMPIPTGARASSGGPSCTWPLVLQLNLICILLVLLQHISSSLICGDPDIWSYKPHINFPSRRECQKTLHVRDPVQNFATYCFLKARASVVIRLPPVRRVIPYMLSVYLSINQSVSLFIIQSFIYQTISQSVNLSINLLSITIYGF
jgi:hypothetical protein